MNGERKFKQKRKKYCIFFAFEVMKVCCNRNTQIKKPWSGLFATYVKRIARWAISGLLAILMSQFCKCYVRLFTKIPEPLFLCAVKLLFTDILIWIFYIKWNHNIYLFMWISILSCSRWSLSLSGREIRLGVVATQVITARFRVSNLGYKCHFLPA